MYLICVDDSVCFLSNSFPLSSTLLGGFLVVPLFWLCHINETTRFGDAVLLVFVARLDDLWQVLISQTDCWILQMNVMSVVF